MVTVEAMLRRALERHGDELILTLEPAFQGFPDTAHGGSVLAAFDAVAAQPGPREVTGRYLKRVPLGEPLRLVTTREDSSLAFRLLDGASTPLVEGGVTPGVGTTASGQEVERPGPEPPYPLPVSTTCFACGTDNTLGLQLRLGLDDASVGGTWRPREAFRAADGTLAPAALTALLDETAFWLGAIASGESGMTTDLRVTLLRPAPFGAAISVLGRRDHVLPREDRRYWETRVLACDPAGPVAKAEITFVAVRGAARRLITGMLAMNPADVLRRVFPAYAR